ncbi:MAG: YceI family protein [Sandaracinus sp.]|nr:YceI family protein [Sandaracinus sp.]
MRAFVSFSLVLALVGCEDPADSVPAAEVARSAATETPSAAPAAEAAATETLTLSPTQTTVAFVGSKVTGSHDGGFRDFTGTIAFDPAAPERSRIEVTIQTASLFVDNDDLAEHLKSPDFFAVEQFPTARFESTEIRAGGEGNATHTITGRLTLHGQTQTIAFPANVTVSDESVRATSEFSIDRTQFGMVYPGRADDLIRDRVVIKLDLTAPRASRS